MKFPAKWKRVFIANPFVLLIICIHAFNFSFAQPANDNCGNTSVITIPNGGFGLGTFTSTIYDISQATLQAGETFAPAILVAGLNKKSTWYKFSIPTTRAVRVILAQPGTAITAGDAGFAVYKTNNCLPSNTDISTKLTPIGTFGNTFHPCVEAGDYVVQVTNFEFSIFSRWGERMFYSKDPRQCWDGRFKGVEQSSDVFVYQIRANGLCGSIYRKGTFVLIR